MVHIAGSLTSALTHLATVGLAAILSTATPGVRLRWVAGRPGFAEVTGPFNDKEMAELVHSHARQMASPDSWIKATLNHEGVQTGLFSPRIKKSSSVASSEALESTRASILTHIKSPLDHAMIGALGRPAFWLEEQPDLGATRWEMKTRNRGEEFVQHRLSPLASAVSGRTVQSIIDGLRGVLVQDDLAKGSESRTATGMRPKGETDSVMAWCALWGISTTFTIPQAHLMSQSSGAWPRDRVHPKLMALPLFGSPVSVFRWAGIMASSEFDRVCFSGEIPLYRDYLKQRGVVGIVLFPTSVGGSSSAPERTILDGHVTLI